MYRGKRTDISGMTKSALLIAMLCASSWFVIPVPFSPAVISLHSIVINMVGMFLTPSQAIITVSIYLLMGVLGFPVFSGGVSGAAKLLSPVGGFYIGFLLSAWLISLSRGKKIFFLRYLLVMITAGMLVQHLSAVVFAAAYARLTMMEAFASISLPFLFFDTAKCVVSAMAAVAVKKALNNRGQEL
jgi:biotin transport system substrate-specific component